MLLDFILQIILLPFELLANIFAVLFTILTGL